MIESLKFIVIEDSPDDKKEVLLKLADFGFQGKNKIGVADSYNGAKELLEDKAEQVDVVFLDLNLPRDSADGTTEKGHGKSLLDLIHKEINRRSNTGIKVIVISGEDLHDGGYHDVFMDAYKDTLIGVVQKSNLTRMLKANIKRLKKDPLRSRISRNNIDVLSYYDTVVDPDQPIEERLKSARSIAIRLVMNDVDYQNRSLDSCIECSDDLNSLIKNYIEERFEAGFNGKKHVKQSAITTDEGWAGFLWRGNMVQHLYTLNAYRNMYVHIAEQPFRSSGATADTWDIPEDILLKVESGERMGKVIELIVQELLEWYLPWHEQVYMPYFHPNS